MTNMDRGEQQSIQGAEEGTNITVRINITRSREGVHSLHRCIDERNWSRAVPDGRRRTGEAHIILFKKAQEAPAKLHRYRARVTGSHFCNRAFLDLSHRF